MLSGNFTFSRPCIVQCTEDQENAHLYFLYLFQLYCPLHCFLNNQTDALIIQIYSVIKLYMFRASSLPIIRSSLLYTRVNKNPSAWNFLKSHTGSDVRYSCHHNSSRFTLLIFAHSCRFSVLHSLQSITPRIYYINRRRQYICLIWN